MKKIILIISILLFLGTNAFAKWKYNQGDIVQGEVIFGKKDTFKLPPGEFIVALVTREREFKDIMLYQIDKDSGYVRWAIHFYATGKTDWGWWNQPKFCKRTNVYFIKTYKGNKNYACWMINHYRSAIPSNKGFWAKVREYEISNGLKNPDIFIGSKHEYSKGSKVWGSTYFYNPELDGVPKPKNLEWNTNEFHKQRIMNYPKHEKFLKKYISVTAKFVDELNKSLNIRGKLKLNPQENFSEATINVEKKDSQNATKSTEKKDIVGELKTLKELLDAGALTQDEFDKAKKKLLN